MNVNNNGCVTFDNIQSEQHIWVAFTLFNTILSSVNVGIGSDNDRKRGGGKLANTDPVLRTYGPHSSCTYAF